MVVVAIMGTLAAIAIPAYNEYRKTAKKGAYKADLTSLHKGWLAFGVELDNFCQRETSPSGASIQNVGMVSLLTSKLYGGGSAQPARCSISGHSTSAACTGATPVAGVWLPAITTTSSPAKSNFIGFGDDDCTNSVTAIVVQDSSITPDDDCELDEGSYTMGVFGHISGASYHGAKLDDNGVFTEQSAVSGSGDIGDTCS